MPTSLFDIYALALPRGHSFGHRPPVGAWESEDKLSCGVITSHVNGGDFGVLVMKRREDHAWAVTLKEHGFTSFDDSLACLATLLNEETKLELIPRNTAPFPHLYDLKNRIPSDLFNLLRTPSHHVAAWLLNQVYLSFPNPDKNWVGDCQTANFHTRLWEAHLLASFREQGLLTTQPRPSPDFRIENSAGGEAWVEAVTANSVVPYNQVNRPPSQPPQDLKERFLGPAAVRFAKTLGSKLQRRYDQMPHVIDKPFIIALADFQAPASMLWSREALIGYLYGMFIEVVETDGRHRTTSISASHLLGKTAFPAGLFCNKEHSELSAVIFTNACSISKFNRVGVSAGVVAKGLRYVRIGNFFDRTSGVFQGIPFCLDITSTEYRELWPQGYEPWSAEMEVFHNPYARNPVPQELLPEVTHWFDKNGDIVSKSYYETSILSSRTIIQNNTDRVPTIADFT